MIRYLLVLSALLAATASISFASEELRYLEEISRQYVCSQPRLLTYEATVKTDRAAAMLRKITADLPPDMPRPNELSLKKYWSRAAGRSTIRMESEQRYPTMAKRVRGFSKHLNIDLTTFFLPPEGRGALESLLARATAKHFESRVEEALNLHISLEFSEPTDIDNAFYRSGLGIPRTGILSVDLDLDPELKTLRRIELSTDSGQYTVEIRHFDLESGRVPQDIRITTADGAVDERLATSFEETGGFLLPSQQVHTLRRNDREETITVNFVDYRINTDLPPAVLDEFGLRTKKAR